jgi:hypothetical protein
MPETPPQQSSNAINIDDKELSVDAITDLLGLDDNDNLTNKTPAGDVDDTEKEVKEPDDEKEPDYKEQEQQELELTDEDQLIDVPRRKEILAAYPDIFKKFPGLEKAWAREAQYTELFSTPAEAKEAKQRADDLSTFEGQLLNGDIGTVLSAIKQESGKAFERIAVNLLGTIQRVDQNAHAYILNQVIKNAIIHAANSAKESQDDQLMIAARLLHKHFYSSDRITGLPNNGNGHQPDNRLTEEQEQLRREQANFRQATLNNAVNDVQSKSENSIRGAVERSIDVRGVMTDYVRKNAINEIMGKLWDNLQSDSRFVKIKDNLWREASNNNFNETSKNRIRNAILNKAKVVLPSIIREVKAEALKGNSSRSKDASESRDNRPLPRGGPSNKASNKNSEGAKSTGKKMSTFDILNQD